MKISDKQLKKLINIFINNSKYDWWREESKEKVKHRILDKYIKEMNKYIKLKED